ncbi:phosphoribosylamine--glycine ligase [Candidatus Roizmanbacteria bacterium]|nr:phosphoribosylamine--glycine ligase [Candidatus Roizmanbacteria bacterium]
MNILIIGGGGREHALGWKLKQSSRVTKLFFAPGNGGTAQLGENVNINATNIHAILSYVQKNNIQLTVVGPEDPLSLGIVDLFEKNKLTIFGPSRLAAQLETSKVWATDFMEKYKIPHPISHTFTDFKKAIVFIKSHDVSKFVVKASGLALGKGVILPQNKKEAQDALERIMLKREFGDAGKEVLFQERLTGPEVSLMTITDGKTIIPLVSAQDHKRIFDNDKGPNTGGMGAYAPVPFMTKKLLGHIQKTILQPTIDGMKKEKIPYKGVLYAGLMITSDGPKVLEYNARFGDPETQPVLALLKSELLSLLFASIQGTLKSKRIIFYKRSSVCIVLASQGYPGSYLKGVPIQGLLQKPKKDLTIFHSGTTKKDGNIITSGGRVLAVTASGKDMNKALQKAYSAIGKKGIYFKGMQYRKDIGKKLL